MASIVPVKVGKYTYLYESKSYRDEQGKPQNNRKPVGKIDPVTGHHIYKPEYLERMAADGQPISTHSTKDSFSMDDIRHSTIRDFGAFYLLRQLADRRVCDKFVGRQLSGL